MARRPRIDFAGARHHVMNRGLRRFDIFVEPDSRERFLLLVAELERLFGVLVCAYALMPNHYHLQVVSLRGKLSAAMQWLQSRFVQWSNARVGIDGPLFRGRFRNRVVLDDTYWTHLFAYIHANPTRAGCSRLLEAEAWTSRNAILTGTAPEWVHAEALVDAFGSVAAYLDYEARMLGDESVGPPGFNATELWSPHETGLILPATGLRRPEIGEAVRAVAGLTGEAPSTLFATTSGVALLPTWLGTWWLWRGSGLTQLELGELLGCSQQVVSKRIRRIEERRRVDPELAAWTSALERRLSIA